MKRVIETFRKFDAAAVTAAQTFDEVEKKLRADYGESNAYIAGYAEAKKIYDETMEAAKEEALTAIRSAFADMLKKVELFALQSAPSDFVPTLEALMAMGEHVTQREAELYFEKYRSNYTAGRAISNYLHDLKGYLHPIPSYDVILDDLANLQGQAELFIRDYRGGKYNYKTMLFTTEKNNPWEKEGEKLQKFLAGDVSVIAEPIENK